MLLNQITTSNFRNLAENQICFSERTNVIIGENGQGKTNLLESIYYLARRRSFRTRFDRELIAHEQGIAQLDAVIYTEDREQTIAFTLRRASRNTIALNGVKQNRTADLDGKLMVVLFCPDDLSLVRAGAAHRRRLMDNALSQLRPKYAVWLAEFAKLYEHKTRILRDWHEKPSLLTALDDFNQRIAQVGAHLIHYRAAFVRKLEEHSAAIHNECSGGREELVLTYQTVRTVADTTAAPAVILGQLLQHQAAHRQAELDAGLCLSGAHKDDIVITIDGDSARLFASQGQTRTAALAIKLAERDMFYDDRNAHPLLLLDDVLSELDRARQDFVLNHIKAGQIFITCCEDKKIAKRTGGEIYTMKQGRVE